MNRVSELQIIIAEDDAGHARLIQKNLIRAGLANQIVRFANGQELLDYRFSNGRYLLLLDIRMPQVDGVEVLRQLKRNAELKKMPVIMVTTTDDPNEVEQCHAIGCSAYIVKPIDYDKFSDAIQQLGTFISMMEVPELNPE